tara:strand:- start:151 stop:282 length:132 start_codon:yes stop_codon:yes gene_type:complete
MLKRKKTLPPTEGIGNHFAALTLRAGVHVEKDKTRTYGDTDKF